MKNAIAVAAALAAPALAQVAGNAIVFNSCSYDVYLSNTPSAGGGYNAIDQTIAPGGSYTQQFTELSNGNGWSMKLSQDAGNFGDNILQYEYTWQGWSGELGGIIWYDLSDVNGNPWDGDWEITATGSCVPRQAAYRYSTDDAYGEQSCPAASDITVTLCSGSGSGSPAPPAPSAWSSSSSAWSPPATTAAPSVSNVPVPVTAPAPTATGDPFNFQFEEGGNVVASNEEVKNNNKGKKGKKPHPTTLATAASPAPNRGGVTVTETATRVVNEFVTATPEAPVKRHQHIHARHPHHRH